MQELIRAMRSSPHFKRYTSFASPVDISPTGDGAGYNCKRMRFETAGTVTVLRASDLASITLNVKDGEYMDLDATQISSVATVSAITVFWS